MSAGTQTNGILSDFGQTIGNMIVPFIAVTIGGGFYRPTYLFVVGIAVIGILYAFVYSKLYLKRHPNNEICWSLKFRLPFFVKEASLFSNISCFIVMNFQHNKLPVIKATLAIGS